MSRRARGTSFTSGRLARLAISPTSPLSTPPERPGQSPVRAPRASERERSGRSPQGNSDKPRMRVYRTSSTLTYNNQNAVAPVTNSFSMPSAVVQTLCVAMPHAAPKSCARVQAAHDRPSDRPPPPATAAHLHGHRSWVTISFPAASISVINANIAANAGTVRSVLVCRACGSAAAVTDPRKTNGAYAAAALCGPSLRSG